MKPSRAQRRRMRIMKRRASKALKRALERHCELDVPAEYLKRLRAEWIECEIRFDAEPEQPRDCRP